MNIPGFTAEMTLDHGLVTPVPRQLRSASRDGQIVVAQAPSRDCVVRCLQEIPRIKSCVVRCRRFSDPEMATSCFVECVGKIDRASAMDHCARKCGA